MTVANNFLPFCPTDIGTNLLTQSEYAAASDRTDGNQPGVASSKLNNKAVRQASYMVSQVAQYISDRTGADLLDDATPARLLAQINAVMKPFAPNVTKLASGTSATFNLTYIFFFESAFTAAAGDTYSDGTTTFTIKATVAAALSVYASGGAAPAAAGTFTRSAGAGTATVTFAATRAPNYLRVRLSGGGGGGGGGSNTGGTGGTGGTTSFFHSGSLLSATGGAGGVGNAGSGGVGGAPTISAGAAGIAITGSSGAPGTGSSAASCVQSGGQGGVNTFGGGAGGGNPGNAGGAGTANTGAGGGGGSVSGGANTGGGGGAGGYIDAIVTPVDATYTYSVGAGGTAGTAGSGALGGVGGSGVIYVEEHYGN